MASRSPVRKLATAFLVATGTIGAGTAGAAQSARSRGSDYVLALSAADRFLGAWQWRDQEKGLSLLSPRLRKSRSEDDLRMYISGISNPHHQAFEIGAGWRLKDGRYSFAVRLYEHYTAQKKLGPKPPLQTLVVVKTAPAEWKVDRPP